MPKAAIHTLGCKVNQYESDRLTDALSRYGYETVDFKDAADLYIVNTCTVTQTGAAKSLQILRRAKSKNPGALTAACGCLVKTNPDDIVKTGADFIFDACKPEELISFLGLSGNADGERYTAFPSGNTDGKRNTASPPQKKRTRAYIKIQDGCDRFCSYCIVPYARGAVRSRPPEEIIEEAEALIQSGTLEIVLTGIQAAAYGKDIQGLSFPRLIKKAAGIPGLVRLRLGSIEPYAVDEEFLNAVSSEKVCPHFHLSLQSGCGKTLEAMNRRYTADFYRQTVTKLRERKPGCALTTDIMAGFPGETEADFNESLSFAEEMKFARAHIFVYSPRQGTPAAALPGQVPERIKIQRGKRMRELAAKLERDYLTGYIGTESPVLFEAKRGRFWEGHTAGYMTVRAESGENLAGKIVNVHLQKETDGILYGGIK